MTSSDNRSTTRIRVLIDHFPPGKELIIIEQGLVEKFLLTSLLEKVGWLDLISPAINILTKHLLTCSRWFALQQFYLFSFALQGIKGATYPSPVNK